jgi:RNA polymerase sigma-70 factor (ECF subfamily)
VTSRQLVGVVNENDATDLVTALYDHWFTKLVYYAVKTTENYQLAEDLAQDSFMQLYLALRAGKEIVHPKAWTLCVLKRAMNRRMIDLLRYESFEEAEDAGKLPAGSSGQGGLTDIQALLSQLTPREVEVLLLRLEAMKYREIADQLGISINSVNTLLARALRKLQGAMMQTQTERRPKDADKQTV